jgi:hypothetical protein
MTRTLETDMDLLRSTIIALVRQSLSEKCFEAKYIVRAASRNGKMPSDAEVRAIDALDGVAFENMPSDLFSALPYMIDNAIGMSVATVAIDALIARSERTSGTFGDTSGTPGHADRVYTRWLAPGDEHA